jgi:hypothetical protein
MKEVSTWQGEPLTGTFDAVGTEPFKPWCVQLQKKYFCYPSKNVDLMKVEPSLAPSMQKYGAALGELCNYNEACFSDLCLHELSPLTSEKRQNMVSELKRLTSNLLSASNDLRAIIFRIPLNFPEHINRAILYARERISPCCESYEEADRLIKSLDPDKDDLHRHLQTIENLSSRSFFQFVCFFCLN